MLLNVKFLDPEAIINQAGLEKGLKVADFGCGSGYFSIPLAQAVGNEGLVYSFDVLKSALESVESRAKSEGLPNIITKRVNLEKERGSMIEDNFFDWVVLKDMLFQNKKKDIVLAEAYRVLKPGGNGLVVEWNENDSTMGPDADLRIGREDLIDLLQAQKFSIEKDLNAGDFHYAMIIKK